jgi:hypothetical protein
LYAVRSPLCGSRSSPLTCSFARYCGMYYNHTPRFSPYLLAPFGRLVLTPPERLRTRAPCRNILPAGSSILHLGELLGERIPLGPLEDHALEL